MSTFLLCGSDVTGNVDATGNLLGQPVISRAAIFLLLLLLLPHLQPEGRALSAQERLIATL
jgi:hypothetical protein